MDARGAYSTIELLDGRDLRELAPLPWRQACRCLRDEANSLGLLHARTFLHRDIPPRNVALLETLATGLSEPDSASSQTQQGKHRTRCAALAARHAACCDTSDSIRS